MLSLALVLPCYNEEDVLPKTAASLVEVFNLLLRDKKISESSFILFVNDGSTDSSSDIIAELHNQNSFIKGLNLSSNVGHQKALLAGLHFVTDKCDAAISLDADLQDDVTVIGEMIENFVGGSDIVYAVRKSRKKDTVFKRGSAKLFYRFLKMMGVKTVYNHSDYRLMSNAVLKHLKEYSEVNVFLRGIVPLIGYKSSKVFYTREKRVAGKSKYPLNKMMLFALDGITSFSVRPLRLIFYVGCLSLLASIASFTYIMVSYFGGGNIAGWTSVMISLWFLGSLTLISLGIIGEYIGKIYTEVKHRPRYHIKSVVF